jgi:hypothetical protein
MTQQRLNSLAVSHIHQEVLDLVDVDALIEEFVSRTEKRAPKPEEDERDRSPHFCSSIVSFAVSEGDYPTQAIKNF